MLAAGGCSTSPAEPSAGASPTVADLSTPRTGERNQVPYDIEVGAVGEGVERAFVLREKGARDGQPLLLFFHGWGGHTTAKYEPWLTHLARQGFTIVFPAYQEPPYDPESDDAVKAFDNAVAGIRLALAEVKVNRGLVVATGVSAGGALAEDYGRAAKRLGLPAAKVIYAVYPGRGLPQIGNVLPVQPGKLPSDVRVGAVASPHDTWAGTRWAEDIMARAAHLPKSRRKLMLVRSEAIGDHAAPLRATPEARVAFWAPLDALIRRAIPAAERAPVS